ncbi:unnamed protein product [Musa banksii]
MYEKGERVMGKEKTGKWTIDKAGKEGMSVALLQTPFRLEKCDLAKDDPVMALHDEEDLPGQFDVWSAIQAQKAANPVASDAPAPYVHPLVRRSSSSLSQKSLEICTESLGSETGSDDFSSFLDELDRDYSLDIGAEKEEANHDMHDKLIVMEEGGVRFRKKETEEVQVPLRKGKELTSVNYHCSVSRQSHLRSFPPPLPSISRRDGVPCLHMRPHRREGRLLVEAVPVPSQNYFHAQRGDGRLLLSFIDATFDDPEASSDSIQINEESNGIEVKEIERSAEEEEVEEKNCCAEDEDEEEEEEEEEVEVVDRGAVIEVKVSTQPQQQTGGAMKVLRSSLVINKFVGITPQRSNTKCGLPPESDEASKTDLNNAGKLQATTAAPIVRRPPPTTTTAAAAVAVASTLSASAEAYSDETRLPIGNDRHLPPDNKLLFTSKRRNREELLHSMRRCSQLRRPLFDNDVVSCMVQGEEKLTASVIYICMVQTETIF